MFIGILRTVCFAAMRLPFASAACEARMTESDTSIT